jgi:hypothetical protein
LRLSANNLNIIKWWVDASYGVHHDMRSHAGGTVSLGTGAACSTSKKQKLNTKSSTEAELVGIDDVLPQALWTKHFMEAQGHGVATILNQDNQSTGKLSENGKASSGKGTRHVNIRCFFITDESLGKMSAFHTAPPRKWWLTASQNRSKEHHSTSSETKSWVWSPWMLSWETTGVC